MCTQMYTFGRGCGYPRDMAEMGMRQLRAELAAVLRRAGSGERVTVTVDGRPVAQVVPVSADDHGPSMNDLVARGLVTPPRRRGEFSPLDPIVLYTGSRIDHALREVR